MLKRLVIFSLLAWSAHGRALQPMAQAPAAADPSAVVRGFVAASNRHDVAHMVSSVAPNFLWMQIEGDRVSVEVYGPDQLKSWLEGYFKSTPDARSEVGEVLWDGRFATAVETVSYRDSEGAMQRQRATSTYHINSEGQIVAVWYFPQVPLVEAIAGSAAPAEPKGKR